MVTVSDPIEELKLTTEILAEATAAAAPLVPALLPVYEQLPFTPVRGAGASPSRQRTRVGGRRGAPDEAPLLQPPVR